MTFLSPRLLPLAPILTNQSISLYLPPYYPCVWLYCWSYNPCFNASSDFALSLISYLLTLALRLSSSSSATDLLFYLRLGTIV